MIYANNTDEVNSPKVFFLAWLISRSHQPAGTVSYVKISLLVFGFFYGRKTLAWVRTGLLNVVHILNATSEQPFLVTHVVAWSLSYNSLAYTDGLNQHGGKCVDK